MSEADATTGAKDAHLDDQELHINEQQLHAEDDDDGLGEMLENDGDGGGGVGAGEGTLVDAGISGDTNQRIVSAEGAAGEPEQEERVVERKLSIVHLAESVASNGGARGPIDTYHHGDSVHQADASTDSGRGQQNGLITSVRSDDASPDDEQQPEENVEVPTVTQAETHYTAGLHAAQAHDFTKALFHFNKASFLVPHEPLLFTAKAEAFVHIGDLRSAVGNYRKSLSLLQRNLMASRVSEDAAQLFASPVELEMQIEKYKLRLAHLLDALGMVYYNVAKYHDAQHCFDEAQDFFIEPDNRVKLHSVLCDIKLRKEKKAVIRQLRELCAEGSEVAPQAVAVMIMMYLESKDFANAKKDLEAVLSVYPNHPLLLDIEQAFDLAFGQYRAQAEELKDVDKLTVCVAAFPLDASLYLQRALAHISHEEYTSAVQDIFEAINRSGGKNEQAIELMGNTLHTVASKLLTFGDHSSAINYFTEALRWRSQDPRLLLSRGSCYIELGRHELALQDFTAVINMDASNEEAKAHLARLHHSWGVVLHNQGKWAIAEEEFTKSINYGGKTDPHPYFHRAQTRLMLQQQTLAVNDLITCRKVGNCTRAMNKLIYHLCPPAEGEAQPDDVPAHVAPVHSPRHATQQRLEERQMRLDREKEARRRSPVRRTPPASNGARGDQTSSRVPTLPAVHATTGRIGLSEPPPQRETLAEKKALVIDSGVGGLRKTEDRMQGFNNKYNPTAIRTFLKTVRDGSKIRLGNALGGTTREAMATVAGPSSPSGRVSFWKGSGERGAWYANGMAQREMKNNLVKLSDRTASGSRRSSKAEELGIGRAQLLGGGRAGPRL